jgi:hypothetical protein
LTKKKTFFLTPDGQGLLHPEEVHLRLRRLLGQAAVIHRHVVSPARLVLMPQTFFFFVADAAGK